MSIGRSSKHIAVLDGLRGIAAVAVLILHASYNFRLPSRPDHAGLAVDFFFCLSGFVIALAYDGALSSGRLTRGEFLLKRLVRLYPMIIAGTVLAAVMAVVTVSKGASKPIGEVVLLTASSAILFPTGLFFSLQAFPFNSPLWSLCFEALANLAYVVIGTKRSSPRLDGVILVVSALALAVAALLSKDITTLGFEHCIKFFGGFARVGFPFLAGVLISRWKLGQGRSYCPDVVLAAVLVLVLLGPALGPEWIYDCAAILLVFPALVILGARATPIRQLTGIWRFLGDISYPLYAIHFPILIGVNKLQNHVLHIHSPVLLAALGVGASIPIAWVAFSYYDRPVRRWLGGLHCASARPDARLEG